MNASPHPASPASRTRPSWPRWSDPPSESARCSARPGAWFASHHITFGAPDDEQDGDAGDHAAPIFPFDPIPRILSALEWYWLERALVQRTSALDLFVADCYGAQRALRDGVVPGRLVYSSMGYLRDLVGARPPRSVYCHVAGIDVVRVGGEFLVLEDNVRVPSGIAYALMSREAMIAVAPDWSRPTRCAPSMATHPSSAACSSASPPGSGTHPSAR